MPKCDFNKVALHGCTPVNLLHIIRTPFTKNTYGWLLLCHTPTIAKAKSINIIREKLKVKN